MLAAYHDVAVQVLRDEDDDGTGAVTKATTTTRRKMTLARRYLDERDARVKWTAGGGDGCQLGRAVLEAAAAAAEAAKAAKEAEAPVGAVVSAPSLTPSASSAVLTKRHLPWMTEALGAKKMTAKAAAVLSGMKRKR